MAAEELIEQELMLNRFNRLIGEVMRGVLGRNSFQTWEVEILLDLETCQLERRRRLETFPGANCRASVNIRRRPPCRASTKNRTIMQQPQGPSGLRESRRRRQQAGLWMIAMRRIIVIGVRPNLETLDAHLVAHKIGGFRPP